MTLLRKFFKEIDARWKTVGAEPVTLQVVGSAALMFQAAYERGPKDGDVLESRDGPDAVTKQLLALAGKKTDIHIQFRVYIDVVHRALLFLPARPAFHPLPDLATRDQPDHPEPYVQRNTTPMEDCPGRRRNIRPALPATP